MADPRHLYGLLVQRGYSPVAAAGILGNLKAESNLNPTIVGDKGTSFGLAQWHGDRWNALNNYAKQQGLSSSSPEAQVGYLDWELRNKERKAYQGLQSAKTPQEAAAAMIHFERPAGYSASNPLGAMHADRRVNNAVNMYGMLSGTPPMNTTPGAMAPSGFTPDPSPSAPGAPMPVNPVIGGEMPNAGAGGDLAAAGQGKEPDYMAQFSKMAGAFGGGGGGGGGAPMQPMQMPQPQFEGVQIKQPQPVQIAPYRGRVQFGRRGLLGNMG